jgi:hypothetical protein
MEAVVDRDHVGEVGVPAGAALLAFTNAVELGGDIDGARRRLAGEIGDEATLEAAAIIAIFNGLVRVADGTGIQLDEGLFAASVDDRELLGLHRFAGALNSDDLTTTRAVPRTGRMAVGDLFG